MRNALMKGIIIEQEKILIKTNKYVSKNIYKDLLRHNFIYRESKTLSKFLVFYSGVWPDN